MICWKNFKLATKCQKIVYQLGTYDTTVTLAKNKSNIASFKKESSQNCWTHITMVRSWLLKKHLEEFPIEKLPVSITCLLKTSWVAHKISFSIPLHIISDHDWDYNKYLSKITICKDLIVYWSTIQLVNILHNETEGSYFYKHWKTTNISLVILSKWFNVCTSGRLWVWKMVKKIFL